MEKKLEEINVSELDANEVLEIGGGGSERKDGKAGSWLDSIWDLLTS
jgi:hypothetical protein